MTVGTALAQAILVSTAIGVTMRYELEFAGLLLLAALLVWFYLDGRWRMLRPLASRRAAGRNAGARRAGPGGMG